MSTQQLRAEPVTRGCNFAAVVQSEPLHRDLPTQSVAAALRLVGAVHEEGPGEVAAIIGRLGRDQLLALAVTLAAMVPDNYTPVELLAWNDCRYARRGEPIDSTQVPLFPAVLVNGRPLKPHGTHAAFVRHRYRGEEPCDACWHGEREYQRDRMRKQRRKVESA